MPEATASIERPVTTLGIVIKERVGLAVAVRLGDLRIDEQQMVFHVLAMQ